MRNLIIGTSGHVDHGKTEIVKALTGRDTDRLKEEKERGISIVLGFAPLDLGDGVTAGIVDVPGHERFVKTMVSGAVGVDLALLVVAADEGVMPQTEEHFEVLRLLGVRDAVIAITKIDLADAELIGLVEEEIRNLVKGSRLRGRSGHPDVRRDRRRARRAQGDAQGARARARRARIGRFLPHARRPRVDEERHRHDRHRNGVERRGAQGRRARDRAGRQGACAFARCRASSGSLEAATAGMRTALALHGVRVSEVEIGMQVLTPGVLSPSNMLNAFVEVGRLAGGAHQEQAAACASITPPPRSSDGW